MLAELKILANKKDVPYQTLAKVYLAKQIALERGYSGISPRKKISPKAGAQQSGSHDS
jgi:hypothetical protein